jgi:exodeoxyribonuclease VII large subunit
VRSKAKSQWEFGDLFQQPSAAPDSRQALSVTELTGQIKRLLESGVGRVWVTGELTNVRVQASGHLYFTLKDSNAQLNCVLFRGESQADRSIVQDGRKVTLEGELTVYEPRGQYQLRVSRVELQGLGALQAAFDKLKQKLQAEGLFAVERKRTLPRYPQRIGLVTSPTGAAIRDVLHVIQRRNPSLEVVFVPSRVQGEGAAAELAGAIALLNEFQLHTGRGEVARSLDLILITRGGGSLEDLWAFNEEILARAISQSAIPVVSAVGHEIDFTISDFVADLRAATPSAAAELITEGVFSSNQFLADAGARIRQLTCQQLAGKQQALTQLARRLARVHPRRRLGDWLQRLDEAQSGLLRCAILGARRQRVLCQNLSDRLARLRPALALKQRCDRVRQHAVRLQQQTRLQLDRMDHQLSSLETRLRLLGPEQILARGYSITVDAESGEVLKSAESSQPGQRLKTRLHLGEIVSRVES